MGEPGAYGVDKGTSYNEWRGKYGKGVANQERNGIIQSSGESDSSSKWLTDAWNYLVVSGKQVVLGNYSTGDVTVLGTAGQVGLGLLGVDAPADARDVLYDLTHWEWTWSHAGQTALDAIGLIPVVGVLKNADEVGALMKGAAKGIDKAAEAAGSADEAVELAKASRRATEAITEGAGKVVKYGDEFGKMGKYVQNPGTKVNWSQYAEHGYGRLTERGMSKELVDSIVTNGKALEQAGGTKYAFITQEGVAVVTIDGKLVTAWSKNFFDDSMKEIIKSLFGN